MNQHSTRVIRLGADEIGTGTCFSNEEPAVSPYRRWYRHVYYLPSMSNGCLPTATEPSSPLPSAAT